MILGCGDTGIGRLRAEVVALGESTIQMHASQNARLAKAALRAPIVLCTPVNTRLFP